MSNKHDDIFNDIAGAEASGGREPNIEEGEYILVLDQASIKQGYKGKSMRLAFKVMEAKKVGADEPNQPESKASYILNFTKNQYAMGNAKAFFIALLGLTEDEAKDSAALADHMAMACSPDQPLRGMRVKCSAYNQPIKTGPNAGKPFTRYNWASVPQDGNDITAGVEFLDS